MAARRTRYLAGVSRNTVRLAFASLFADISTEMLYLILPGFFYSKPACKRQHRRAGGGHCGGNAEHRGQANDGHIGFVVSCELRRGMEFNSLGCAQMPNQSRTKYS